MSTTYYIPPRPYSPIDALNRRAAAVGSPGYGAATANADYNGHHVTVSWNEYRGYYVAAYWWAGQHVLARGSFERCLRAALSEHNRGALGSCVSVALREGDEEAIALCAATPELVAGSLDREPAWLTWQHAAAAESVRDYAHPGALRLIFDWALMQAAEDREAYEAALRAKYGRAYR